MGNSDGWRAVTPLGWGILVAVWFIGFLALSQLLDWIL